MARLLAALAGTLLASHAWSGEADGAPAIPQPDLETLATGFVCTEIVSVEVVRGERTDRIPAGEFEYFLKKPRKKKSLPYVFVEQRSPRSRHSPWNRLEQPAPVTWLTLDDPDRAMFRITDCEHGHLDCEAFTGKLAYRNGDDPREWRGTVWRDGEGRIHRVEAIPGYQGERVEGLVQRGEGGGVGGPPGVPGSGFGEPRFRLDGTVEEIHCEIVFAETFPGWILPRRSVCNRDEVTLRGRIKKRWSLVREFAECKRFTVETEETLQPVSASPGPAGSE